MIVFQAFMMDYTRLCIKGSQIHTVANWLLYACNLFMLYKANHVATLHSTRDATILQYRIAGNFRETKFSMITSLGTRSFTNKYYLKSKF